MWWDSGTGGTSGSVESVDHCQLGARIRVIRTYSVLVDTQQGALFNEIIDTRPDPGSQAIT